MLLLNLDMVRKELSFEPAAVIGDIFHELIFQDVRLLSSSDNTALSDNYLYMMDWKRRPAGSAPFPKYMICVGGGKEAERFLASLGVTCMLYPESVDFALLMSEVQEAFTKYHNLHHEYRLLLITQQPMYMILDFCASLMGNYAFLLDSEYNIVDTCSSEFARKSGLKKQEFIPLINAISEKIGNRCKNAKITSDFLIEHVEEGDGLPEFYFTRFFDANQCIGTLVVCYSGTPFSPYSPALMHYLANLLQPCMAGRYSPVSKTHGYIRKMINSLICDNSCNVHALEESLSLIGWSLNDSYQLLYIRNDVGKRRVPHATSDFYRYESLFPDCIAFHDLKYACTVVVIHNATGEIPEKTLNSLRDLMVKNKSECRFSLPFSDFLQVKNHFDMVRDSLLNMGGHQEPISMYKDVMAKHLLTEVGKHFPIRALCHQAALKLQEYDIQNGTEMLNTLEKYLMYNKSIQRAGEELYIHRNTISYRLRIIEELTNISFDSEPDNLYLLISCIILRILGE